MAFLASLSEHCASLEVRPFLLDRQAFLLAHRIRHRDRLGRQIRLAPLLPLLSLRHWARRAQRKAFSMWL